MSFTPAPIPFSKDGGPSPAERRQQILATIPDPGFADRLRAIWTEAGRAIDRLSELEIGRYTDMAETGYPDLSMWEEVAPVIRNMIMDVNAVLATARQAFPARTGGLADLIGDALGEPEVAPDAATELRKREAAHHVEVLANALAADITNLGERLRSPQVVSDRWNLLADLQEYRGKFRGYMSDFFFLTANCFAPVTRDEVVPGYREEVAEAVAARRAVTDLARLLAVHEARVLKAPEPELSGLADQLTKDLDAFGKSRAYVVLRTQDKRRFVEFRAQLHELQAEGRLFKLRTVVGDLARFTSGLSTINRRATLMEHDREVLAACGVKLEAAEGLVADRPAEALALFGEALQAAQALYGRSPGLDTFLRKARKRELMGAGPGDVSGIEEMRALIAAAMAF